MRASPIIMCSALLMTISISARATETGMWFANLSGFDEIPSILSDGSGIFKWSLDKSGTMLSYRLTFTGLSSNATAAHIHFGGPHVNGAPIAFLCGGSKPPCPPTGGVVTGIIMANDILPIPSQGVHGGSFNDFLAVMRSGNAYVNVHTVTHTAGEIRGQIKHFLTEGEAVS